MRKISIFDVVISLVVVAFVALIFMPAAARMQRDSSEAKCQSNMLRWSQALALYTGDNDGFYPTNRLNGSLVCEAPMSYDRNGNLMMDANGDPVMFNKSANWVESLYPYILKRARSTDQDWRSFMKCPKAYDCGGNSIYGYISYVMNYNLIEYNSSLVRNNQKVMLLRETDRLYNSMCRPTNMSMSNLVKPNHPFLAANDPIPNHNSPALNSALHGNGSYIVFADGHIHWFDISYFQKDATTFAVAWDSETSQWWNYVYSNPQTDQERALNKSIAITP
jgi:prepilin-type processing-associated H-X9-DG protein